MCILVCGFLKTEGQKEQKISTGKCTATKYNIFKMHLTYLMSLCPKNAQILYALTIKTRGNVNIQCNTLGIQESSLHNTGKAYYSDIKVIGFYLPANPDFSMSVGIKYQNQDF